MTVPTAQLSNRPGGSLAQGLTAGRIVGLRSSSGCLLKSPHPAVTLVSTTSSGTGPWNPQAQGGTLGGLGGAWHVVLIELDSRQTNQLAV